MEVADVESSFSICKSFLFKPNGAYIIMLRYKAVDEIATERLKLFSHHSSAP